MFATITEMEQRSPGGAGSPFIYLLGNGLSLRPVCHTCRGRAGGF